MTESSKPPATTSVALLSIQANGMKSVRYGRDTMPADAFYQVENRAGKVIARSSMLAALNPSWPPLEFEVQGGRNRKISLVFYDYNPKKPRRSFEIACIETNLNELYEAVAAHKKNKDKPSYSLPSFGLEVYICDLEEKHKIPQSTPDLADDMTTASSISNPLVPILEDEEEEDDHEEIRSTDKYDVVNNNNFIGLVDETESLEKNDSSAAINNRKDQEKEEAVTFVVGNKFLSPTMCQQLESKAACSSNSTLSSDSSNSTLDPITENKSDANCDGSKIVQDANTSTGKKLPSSSLTGYDEEDDGGNKEQTVAATPLSAVVTGSHKNEDFDPCKAEKEEEAIAVLVENNFLVSKQRLPSAKNHGCDSSFTSNSSFTSTEVDTFAEQESRNHNEDRESREDSISRLQKSPSTVLSGRYQDGACAELKLPITSPSTLITGSYQHEGTNYEDFDVSISSSQEECAQSSILAGRFRQEPGRDDADINSMNEDEELVSDSSYSDDEGDCDQQLHCNWKINDENVATTKQPPSRTTPEGEERQMIELHILATGISSSSSDNLNTISTYYYEVENEAGDAIGRSSLTATCSEKKAVCHLDFHALCGGNADRRISLVFYHNSKEIACIETSMTELHRATKAYQLQTNADDKRESFGIDGDDDDPNINEFKVFICHVAKKNTSDNGNMLVPEKEHKVISSPLTAADQKQKSFRVKNKFWRFKKFINKKKHFDN